MAGEVTSAPAQKPGLRTTEFGLTGTLVLAGVGAASSGSLSWQQVALFGCLSLAVSIYALARALTKKASA